MNPSSKALLSTWRETQNMSATARIYGISRYKAKKLITRAAKLEHRKG